MLPQYIHAPRYDLLDAVYAQALALGNSLMAPIVKDLPFQDPPVSLRKNPFVDQMLPIAAAQARQPPQHMPSLLAIQHGNIALIADLQAQRGGDIAHLDIVRAVFQDAFDGDFLAVHDHFAFLYHFVLKPF